MNNPFDRATTTASPAAGLNNPFDSDPTNARNRFPDLTAQLSGSPSPQPSYFPQGAIAPTSPWPSAGFYQPSPNFNLSQQQQGLFSPNPTPQFANAFPQQQSQPNSGFVGGGGAFGASGYNSPYGNPQPNNSGFAGGVASGGSYASSFGLSSGAGGSYSQFSPTSGFGSSSLHPQLSQFDPLSPQSQQRPAMQSTNNNSQFQSSFNLQLSGGGNEMDPGSLIYHPRNPAQPNNQMVTGFNGQTTLHIPIRPHSYGPMDHPRHVIAMHRVELEQWDQYGWRQCLNALENLRVAWETFRDDVARVTDIGCPPHENAITLKMKKEASENIDNVTAAYLQMQEVFASYRQSHDPSSKKRVRECLNAGLKSLPDWP
ncbi:hypothetical protein PIIN_04337 [Serendipita indica DSM 11827]|uniref:Uncharacterized protein n=1 Tax=Serendipita indica (strain DSM 11827) TaxID=1109443 RepID=G4TGE9_SERID|nr:hypothetical protein PIIN_04337 [Serendipita indica DSM 11827]